MAGQVTYEKTADDLVGMYRDLFAATLRRNPARKLRRLAALLAVVALLEIVLVGSFEGAVYPFLIASLSGLALVAVCLAVSYLTAPSRARKLFRQQKTDDPTWTWRWSDEAIECTSANGNNRYRWRELHRWCDGRRTMMFFLNDSFVLYLPLRVLTTKQADDLRAHAAGAGIQRF